MIAMVASLSNRFISLIIGLCLICLDIHTSILYILLQYNQATCSKSSPCNNRVLHLHTSVPVMYAHRRIVVSRNTNNRFYFIRNTICCMYERPSKRCNSYFELTPVYLAIRHPVRIVEL